MVGRITLQYGKIKLNYSRNLYQIVSNYRKRWW